ncbi:MAG: Mut7-C ubiquitin/RNAse domain-containing protein [Chloroflexi bacterium]|nr:Mut7-C ubiquitin/RNAse domain-containing protein [Chloroflexota bacterium]
MSQARFRFYAELNHFLPNKRKQVEFTHTYSGRVSIKDMIESFGIPHTEIDLILVNGESVDFSYLVQHDDRISVYPVFESFDITPVIRLRPKPLRDPRFVLDVHLGRLASYLRMLGFDALFPENYDDPHLAHISAEQHRTLLTRDRGLLMRNKVTHGYYVRETNPRQQVIEVLRRFDLFGMVEPFKRCISCNGELQPVDKAAIIDRLPPSTAEHYDEFRQCSDCEKIYWRGSHYEKMRTFVANILQHADPA